MTSPDGDAFQKALSDFTFDAACGGAIRHLADSGCTVKQIMERLAWPVSEERVRQVLYRHLCDTGVILEKPPEEGLPEAKPEYVLEYDSYGKPSYRRKSAPDGGGASSGPSTMVWEEKRYRCQPAADSSGKGRWKGSGSGREKGFGSGREEESGKGRGEALSAFLWNTGNVRGGQPAWISCDFGVPGSPVAEGCSRLNGRQREFLEGIPWPRHRVYHRLDQRMREIICSLYGQGMYEGVCYFLSCREKWLIL